MVEISNIKVYDMAEAIIASAYPMLTTPPNKDELYNLVSLLSNPSFIEDYYNNPDNPNYKHFKRALKLANTSVGSGHNNFLKGIRVSFDIKYPNYFTPELQRYNFIDIVSSSSKMHRLVQMDLNTCFNKYVDDNTKNNIKYYIEEYNKEPSYEHFMKVISNCPLGIELFMRISTNYLQLKTIYKQRLNHKLKEDWGAFIKFIEELPYAKELIL